MSHPESRQWNVSRPRTATWFTGAIALVISLLALTGAQPGHSDAASLNSTMIYWLNDATSTIKKVTSAGTGIATIPGVTANYRGLASDGTYLYYTTSSSEIRRTSLDGGTSTLVATTSNSAANIFVDSTYIYYADWNAGVYRVRKDGSQSPTLIISAAAKNAAEPNNSSNGFSSVMATSSYVYFITYGSGGGTSSSVFRANLDGSSVTRLYSAQAAGISMNANDFWVSDTKIYLPSSNSSTGIVSMNLDGSSPSALFRAGRNYRSVEVAGDYMYFTDGNVTVGRFPLADNNVAATTYTTASTASSVWDIAVVDAPTVTYNGNGNTSGNAPTDSSSPYRVGDTVTVSGNTGSLAKSGYEFNGWQLSQGGAPSNINGGSTFTITNVATLTAQWIAGPLEFAASDSAVASTSFAFPITEFGSTSTLTVVVRNMGSASRTIDSITSLNTNGVSRTGGTCSTGGSPDIAAFSQGSTPTNSCNHIFSWTPTSDSQVLSETFVMTSGNLSPSIMLTGTATVEATTTTTTVAATTTTQPLTTTTTLPSSTTSITTIAPSVTQPQTTKTSVVLAQTGMSSGPRDVALLLLILGIAMWATAYVNRRRAS